MDRGNDAGVMGENDVDGAGVMSGASESNGGSSCAVRGGAYAGMTWVGAGSDVDSGI